MFHRNLPKKKKCEHSSRSGSMDHDFIVVDKRERISKTGLIETKSLIVKVISLLSLFALIIYLSLSTYSDKPQEHKDMIGILHRQEETLESPSVDTWIAGMVLDIHRIQKNIKETIFQLNCDYQVGVHIMIHHKDQVEALHDEYLQSLGALSKKSKDCAPFVIIHEQDLQKHAGDTLAAETNRIDRISILRDRQRHSLFKYFSKHSNNSATNKGVIILLDFDLFAIPPKDDLVMQSNLLKDLNYPHDVVCAAGITMSIGREKGTKEPFYYDTFALAFYPDTFSHPLKRRLIPYSYSSEDRRLIRSDDQRGNFTQGDIYRHLELEASKVKTGTTRVKSCFGGLAMYRSSTYFEEHCTYELQSSILEQLDDWDNSHLKTSLLGTGNGGHGKSIARYANNKEKRPCEHVVLHDCLATTTMGKFSIAVNPSLKTLWKRDF